MRPDLYTKAVLTIIAVCLVWISLGGPSLLAPISAQQQNRTSGYERVLIAGWIDNGGKEHQLLNPPTTGMPVFIVNP